MFGSHILIAAADGNIAFTVIADFDIGNQNIIHGQTAAKRVADTDGFAAPIILKFNVGITVIADLQKVEARIFDIQTAAEDIAER